MPRRWLSIRDRKEEDRPTLGGCDGFDFAFAIKPSPAGSSVASPDPQRPRTSGHERRRVKQKPDLTLLIERPSKSRGSLRHNAPLSAGLPDSPHIGIAFGSPRNPPQGFGGLALSMSPSHNCFVDESSPSRTPSTRKWKKIGGLFKPRSNSDKVLPIAQQQQVGIEAHKLGLPIHRARWRNPKSPPNVHHGFREHPAFARSEHLRDRAMTLPNFDSVDLEKFLEANPVPSLHVRIPGSPLDRCSVMFKNVSASPKPFASGKQQEAMEQVVLDLSPTDESPNNKAPELKRRLSSPTTSKPTDRPRTASQSIGSNRYSLFPITPTPSRPQSQHRHSSQPSPRPSTAPAQVLPLPEGFPSPPKRLLQDPISGSPTSTQTSVRKELPHPTPLATLEISEKFEHSRGSSSGEIYFDVKSFRGSQGHDVDQYEMTRPPSVEVQLARSKSNARKQIQARSNIPVAPDMCNERPIKTTSTQIDETIALVESLTSASVLTDTDSEEKREARPRQVVDGNQQPTAPLPSNVDTAANQKTKRKSAKVRSEGLNIAVPSPVLESIEEATPRIIDQGQSMMTAVRGAGVGKLNHIASRALAASTGVTVSRTQSRKESPSPVPPAVPVKDSKFIPLSRYAPKHTSEDLVRQTGLRPVRSNTDDTVSYNSYSASFRKEIPLGRSYTMPSPHSPRSSRPVIATQKAAGTEVSARSSREMPMVVAYVKPSAEVSIARTVSLSRKPKAKIMVSRQPSRSESRAGHRPQRDIAEKKVSERIAVVQEVHSKHKHGLSQDAILEVVDIASTNLPPPVPSVSEFTKALDGFPTPPTSAI